MRFLLDTNVVAEWVKPQPEQRVVDWLAAVDEDRLFLSVATLAEIRHGVEAMTPGRRRTQIATWLTVDLPRRFEGQILEIDQRVAQRGDILMARARNAGRPIKVIDAFLLCITGRDLNRTKS